MCPFSYIFWNISITRFCNICIAFRANWLLWFDGASFLFSRASSRLAVLTFCVGTGMRRIGRGRLVQRVAETEPGVVTRHRVFPRTVLVLAMSRAAPLVLRLLVEEDTTVAVSLSSLSPRSVSPSPSMSAPVVVADSAAMSALPLLRCRCRFFFLLLWLWTSFSRGLRPPVRFPLRHRHGCRWLHSPWMPHYLATSPRWWQYFHPCYRHRVSPFPHLDPPFPIAPSWRLSCHDVKDVSRDFWIITDLQQKKIHILMFRENVQVLQYYYFGLFIANSRRIQRNYTDLYITVQRRIQDLWKGGAGNPNSSMPRPKITKSAKKTKIGRKKAGPRPIRPPPPPLDPPLLWYAIIHFQMW